MLFLPGFTFDGFLEYTNLSNVDPDLGINPDLGIIDVYYEPNLIPAVGGVYKFNPEKQTFLHITVRVRILTELNIIKQFTNMYSIIR